MATLTTLGLHKPDLANDLFGGMVTDLGNDMQTIDDLLTGVKSARTVVHGKTGTATSGTPGYNSYDIILRGSGWDGAAAQDREAIWRLIVASASDYRLALLRREGGVETELLSVDRQGVARILGNVVWHAGNDGANSGLDADLLDGLDLATTATPNTVMQRDNAGRAKVAAPLAADDIARKDTVDAHATRTDNPHAVTKAQVGLGNVDDIKQMPISGGTFTGRVVAQNNTDYTVFQVRNIVLSTADPSGGGNGDVWIKYTP